MKLMRPPFACTLCAALFAGSVGSALAQARSGVDSALFDPSVRVQDDLFRHVNGTWLKTVPIPADTAVTLRACSSSERGPGIAVRMMRSWLTITSLRSR